MTSENTGPDERTLKFLNGMMPSLIKGKQEQRIGGKGVKVALPPRPRKLCTICCAGFDLGPVPADGVMGTGICEKCQKQLDEGYTAVTCGTEFMMVRSQRLQDLTNADGTRMTIIPVSSENFAKLKAEYNREWDTSKPASFGNAS